MRDRQLSNNNTIENYHDSCNYTYTSYLTVAQRDTAIINCVDASWYRVCIGSCIDVGPSSATQTKNELLRNAAKSVILV